MKSRKKMGNYYVAKTIKFLEEDGYHVARLETNHMVFVGGRQI
jgi:predicted RNA binding protein YcfA (HicA-like mRNA interferase family)